MNLDQLRAVRHIADRLFVNHLWPASSTSAEVFAEAFDFDEADAIKGRPWLYHPHLRLGTVSVLHGLPGAGKSALAIAWGLVIATGRPLLGITPSEQAGVLYVPREDDRDEQLLRVRAATLHFGIDRSEIRDRFFIRPPERALTLARSGVAGIEVDLAEERRLVDFILSHDISLVIFDPLVGLHSLHENDNTAMHHLMDSFARIARNGNCAVLVVAHDKRSRSGSGPLEGASATRGAGVIIADQRAGQQLRTMSPDEAKGFGIPEDQCDEYVRLRGSKVNATRRGAGTWFQLVSVQLKHGEEVHTIAPWSPPDPFDEPTEAQITAVIERIASGRGRTGEPWRANIQAGEAWVGHAVAEALELDLSQSRETARVIDLLRRWGQSGVLRLDYRPHGPKKKVVPFIVPG